MKTIVNLIFVVFILFGTAGFSQDHPADIVTNSKKVEAEQLFEYHNGLAIITRGQLSTVINSSGNPVIPYGKYKFISQGAEDGRFHEGFVNGYCIVQDPNSYLLGVIDTLGKLVINFQYRWVSPFDDEGYAVVITPEQRNYFITRQNKKIPLDPVFIYDKHLISSMPNIRGEGGGLEALFEARPTVQTGPVIYDNFVDGLCVGEKSLFGYFDRTGKKIINDIYVDARPFSEGLAAVALKNKFGEVKWGFIDKTGKTVIDFMFKNQPGDFHSGLSVVTPAEKSDFAYAFIDKKGTVFYSVKDPTKNKYRDFQGDVAFVNENGHMALLDRSGTLRPLEIKTSKVTKKGKPMMVKSFSYYQQIVNKNILIEIGGKQGLMDTNGNLIVPAIFESVSHYDPTSKLAKATYLTANGEKVEGYINKDIHFVSIKELSKSKW